MVAILMPDKISADQIGNDDILWIKCPGFKTIATVLKAFKQRETQPVKFIQRPKVLSEFQLVSSLITDDELCIIEAVREDNVSARLRVDSTANPAPALTPTPMRDITNNAVDQMPVPPPDQYKAGPPKAPFSLPPVASRYPPIASHVPPVAATSPAGLSTSGSQTLLRLAWVDFTFERREHIGRRLQSPPFEAKSYIDDCVAREWTTMSSNQRQFFVDRVSENLFRESTER